MRPCQTTFNRIGFLLESTGIKRKQYRLFQVRLMHDRGRAGNPALTCVSASNVRPVTQAIKLGQCAAHGKPPSLTAFGTFRLHWPEYLMEASLLGAFMASASIFCVLLEYPHSPVRLAIAGPAVRRFLIGISMGLTAIAIIYSPWGRPSGADINPSAWLFLLLLPRTHESKLGINSLGNRFLP